MSSSSSIGHSGSNHSSGGQSSSVQSNATQSQNSTNSNQRLAQNAVQGGATVAGAALGGATGAKIGSKVGSAVNNSKVGQGLTNGVGNAMNNINKLNPANKIAQNVGNKLANKDTDTNNASGSSSSTPPPTVPTSPTSPSTLGQGLVPSANTFNKNNVSKDKDKKSKVSSKNSTEPKNINKDSYKPWQNSKNPSKNRRPMSQQNSYDEDEFEDQLGDESQEQNDVGKGNNKDNGEIIKTPFSGNKKSKVNGKAIELIKEDKYDLIVVYNGNYDSTMHHTGPESKESIDVLKENIKTYSDFVSLIKNEWKDHDVFYAFAPDHGCHEIDGDSGAHGLCMEEDMNIIHFYGVKPKNE